VKPAIVVTWIALVAMFIYMQARLGSDETDTARPTGDSHFELALPMGRIQAYADKLYFSGRNENWPLAAFYLHEMEEQAEEIVEAKVEEDGIDVSKLTEGFLLTHIEALEKHVKAGQVEPFLKEYDVLVGRCNACHEATKHGFLKILTPTRSMFQNQDYAPGPSAPKSL